MGWTDSVTATLSDAVLVVDRSMRITALNPAAERLLGCSAATAVGRPLQGLLPALHEGAARTALACALAGEERACPAFAADLGPRGPVWLAARCVPCAEDGAAAGAIVFLTDVTVRRRHDAFTRAVGAVGHVLSASRQLSEVLEAVVTSTLDVMGADTALVLGGDGTAPTYTVLRARGRLARAYAAARTLPVGRGPVYQAIVDARAVATRNLLTDPRWWLPDERRREIEVEGYRAVAAAPLAARGRVHGALVVHYWAERAVADDEVDALARLAELAAIAIDNTGLYGEATRRAERLRELAEVERAVTGSLDIDDVLRRIADASTRLLGAPVAQVWTMHREAGMLARRATSVTAALAEETLPPTMPADDPLARVLDRERSIVYVADVDASPLGASLAWAAGFGLRALLAVPIVDGDELLGVLTLHGSTDWAPGEEDRTVLVSLAARVALAVRHARAYGDAVQRAARLSELVAVTQSISASLDTTAVIDAVVHAAAGLARGASAIVHVYEPERRLLRTVAVSDVDVARLPTEIAPGDGLPGLVAEERRVVVVRNPRTHPRLLAAEWWAAHPGATYCGVPIFAGDAFLGVLDLIVPDRAPWVEEQEMLQLLAAHAGFGLQNAGLYRDAMQRRELAESLARLGRELTATLDAARIEAIVTRGLVDLLGVRTSVVYRYSAAEGTLTATAADGPESSVMRGLVLRAGEGVVGVAVAQRRLVVSADLLSDTSITLSPELRARIEAHGVRAVMAAPLVARDRVLGALVVGAERGRRLSPDQLQALQAFADQTALALENARLYGETERERREAAALAAAARQLAASLDVDELADQLVGALRELFGAHGSALYRVQEDGTIVSVAFGGAARHHMRVGEVVDRRAGIIGRAVDVRRPVWSRDVLDDPTVTFPDEFRAAVVAAGNRAVLAVPLVAKQVVVGVLAISESVPRSFHAHEIALLQAFADQAALALENARLYAAARDSLARLRNTQVQLVQAAKMSALGQLVSGVAHELNNPLSVVIGYGQLLLARDIPPPVRRPLELIVSQGDRMAKIVRGLLFFARQRPPERVAVLINEVVEDTVAMRFNQLALSGIALERRLADDLPTISADAQQLQQVLLNLLLNAEQAILDARRGGRIAVATSLADGGAGVRIQVTDDGPGISADTLPHVFEPFFTTKEIGVGTGLGLSVSYGIVQEHGGRLTVESQAGETTFTIELPASAEPDTAAGMAPALRVLTVEDRAALVVEDEPSVSDLVVTLLHETGWRVDVESGGRAALARLRERPYDLVVTDMRMADGNGEELYEAARALDTALAGRFLFITGDTANPEASRFFQQSRVPVLEKPFAPAVFLDAIRRVTLSLTPSRSPA